MLVLLSGCVYDRYPEAGNKADEQLVMLLLRVGTTAPTRADAPAQELMHSLRIVLVNADDDTIEYNTLIDESSDADLFGNGVNEFDYSKYRLIRTVPGRKKIYIVANESSAKRVNGENRSLTTLLDSKEVGETGFGEMVDNIYFTPDFDDNLVLSSYYEFTIEDDPGQRTVQKEFWLVHAATKFEFRFENNRSDAVSIDRLTVSQSAGDMYLMANLAQNEKTKQIDGTNYWWVEWLKRVCDDTTANPNLPENPNVNERYGWISNYYLPSADHADVDIKARVGGTVDYWQIAPGGTLTLPEVYCSESKYMPDGETQKYTFSIQLTDTGEQDEQTATKEFPDNEFVNVKALFRNTHVKVTVSISVEFNLDLKIGVCPWYYEDIDIPTFD